MKKHLKALLAIILAFALSGCVKLRLSYDIGKDGSVSGTFTQLYSMHALTTLYPDMNDSQAEELLSSLKKQMEESYPDATITYVSEGEGDNFYAGYTVSGIKNIDGIEITKEGTRLTLKYPVDKKVNALLQQNGLSDLYMDSLIENGLEASIDFNMPGKPESAIGEITGNTVHVNLLDLPKGTTSIVITCSTFPLIPVAIGAAAVVILGILFAIRRK